MSPEDLAKLLDQLGQRLTPPAERAFALAVQYEVTTSLIWIVVSAAFIVAASLVVLRTVHWARRTDVDDPWFPASLLILGAGFVGIIAFLQLTFCFITLVNPEYTALKHLLQAVPR